MVALVVGAMASLSLHNADNNLEMRQELKTYVKERKKEWEKEERKKERKVNARSLKLNEHVLYLSGVVPELSPLSLPFTLTQLNDDLPQLPSLK